MPTPEEDLALLAAARATRLRRIIGGIAEYQTGDARTKYDSLADLAAAEAAVAGGIDADQGLPINYVQFPDLGGRPVFD